MNMHARPTPRKNDYSRLASGPEILYQSKTNFVVESLQRVSEKGNPDLNLPERRECCRTNIVVCNFLIFFNSFLS